MIITRKIQIFIPEDSKDLRKSYYEKLYNNRNIAVKIANLTVSHLFALDNTMPYLSDEDKGKIIFLGVKGQKATKRNAPYVAASELFKGKIDMGVCSTIQNTVTKTYQEDKKSGMWNKSLRSYKANMPVPYQADRFLNMRFVDIETKNGKYNGCFFELTGIPFQMRFGRDRSNNRLIVKRAISGEYKMVTSSIQIDDRNNKIFLLLCVDIPKKEIELKKDNSINAHLSIANPIVAHFGDKWMKEIGTKEEFLHRRIQIQQALKRCQINALYSKGGKGRNKKLQSTDYFHKKELNYVDTKLHTYSKILVDYAVKNECSVINLVNQKEKEVQANIEPFILRNWSYYGLKTKIEYKAKMYGIEVKEITV